MMPNRGYVTTGEAARLLDISKPTLIRAVELGKIRPDFVTPGGHRRFDTQTVMEYLTVLHGAPR